MALNHVYWMGGSPCAGKSSISALLAQEYGLQVFSVDGAFNENHKNHLDPQRQATLHKWATTPWSDLWMQPADVLLTEARTAYGEHFEMVVDDVRFLSDASPVLVEGTALLPDHVHRLHVDHRRAIWLVPTEGFQRTHYPHRGDWVQMILDQCQDPDQALENWMARDVAFAKWVADRTRALSLSLIQVDGTRTIEATAALVAQRFQLR